MATERDVRERAHASQIGWYMQSTTEPERRGWQSTARPLRQACDARGSIAATEVTWSRFNSGRQISKSCTSHLKNGANACARGATPWRRCNEEQGAVITNRASQPARTARIEQVESDRDGASGQSTLCRSAHGQSAHGIAAAVAGICETHSLGRERPRERRRVREPNWRRGSVPPVLCTRGATKPVDTT